MKKFLNSAFTMAEAILVMTILGIIATIMISTLKPAEFKEKGMQVMAKKVLSELDVATTQILMNNTADGTFDKIYEAGSTNVLYPNFFDSGKLATLYKSYLTTLRKEPVVRVYSDPPDASFLLKDGASVTIFFEYFHGNTIFPGEINLTTITGSYGCLSFDINDNEPPNILGKDRFILPFDKHGIKYAE